MKSLVMMLQNSLTKKYHPIFYFEKPLAGDNNSVTRYKSKGHHTEGFEKREDAIKEAESVKDRLINEMGYSVLMEIDENQTLLWEDADTPADTQIR